MDLPKGWWFRCSTSPSDADWIQLAAGGDETTIFPFLTGFARQNPSLDPIGSIGLNFRFPPTQFSSDAFPTSIDPLATVPSKDIPCHFWRGWRCQPADTHKWYRGMGLRFHDRSVEHELHAQQRNAKQHILRNNQLCKPRRTPRVSSRYRNPQRS